MGMGEGVKGSLTAVWFSGFFGLAALVHLVRLLFQVPLVVGGRPVPMAVSVIVVLVAGILSLRLFSVGRGGGSCCWAK